jgi:rhodanese-related sulfurtransferase
VATAFATAIDRRYNFKAMKTATAIDPNITMRELLVQFPGAQRALFRKYHIGGCSSCGFSPEETLAQVCARNENLDVDLVIDHIVASEEAERAMQIGPRELADRIRRGDKINLLDVRTREEFDAVKIDNAQLFTQELMQEILAKWSREDLLVIYDHEGTRSMDAAAYFQGHGFENVKGLRGGIDAWSVDVDSKLPRYHLEPAR